jgi:hypothetical protein
MENMIERCVFGYRESSQGQCQVDGEGLVDTPLPQFIFNLEEISSR